MSTLDLTQSEALSPHVAALIEFALAVHATPNLDAVLDAACSVALARLGCCDAGVFLSPSARTMASGPVRAGSRLPQLALLADRAGAGPDLTAIDQLSQYPHLRALAQQAGLTALAVMPLEAQGQALGNWALGYAGARGFPPEELDALRGCARHLSYAVFNALLMDELFTRTQRLSITAEIGRELNSRLDLAQLLRQILEMSVLGVKADSGSLIAFDELGRTLSAWLYEEPRLYEASLVQTEQLLRQGVAGWVVDRREAVHIPDTGTDTRWKPGAGLARSVLCLPLLYSNEVVGVMTLGHRKAGALHPEDLELASAVADQAALAVQNARLYRAAEARARQLATLNEVSRSVTSTLDLNSVLELIVNKTLELLNAEAGSLVLVEGPQRDLVFRVTRGTHPEQVAGLRLPWGTGLTGKAAADGVPIISSDVRSDPRWFPIIDQEAFARSIMVVPLIHRDTVIGVLTAINKHGDGGFTAEDITLMSSFAGQAAVAVGNARLFSSTDEALARRVDELYALETITREIASSLDLNEVIDVLLVRALAVTRAARGFVVLGLAEVGAGGAPADTGGAEAGIVAGGELRVVAARGYRGDGAGVSMLDRIPLARGVIGQVVRTRQAVVQGDVRDAQEAGPGDPHARSVLCVPIIYERTLLGAIKLEADEADALNQNHASFLAQLADHAALAIQNARLHHETEQQLEATRRANRRIRALQDGLAAVQSALGLDEVLQRVADAVVSLGYSAVLLAPYDEVHRTLEIRALSSVMPERLDALERLFGRPLLGITRSLDERENLGVRSFLAGKAERSSNFAEFWAPLPEASALGSFGYGVSLPLRTGGRPVGNMYVFALQRDYSDEDLGLLQTFADQAGVALDKARLFAEVSRVRDRLQTVLNSVRDGIGMFDATGTIMLVNPAVQQLLGLDLSAALGKAGEPGLTFDELQRRLGYPDHTLDRVVERLHREAPGLVRRTFRVEGPRRLFLEELIVPVYDQHDVATQLVAPLRGWLVVWHDVTNQKELEQTREELTHMLVHDLRSPLGSVIGGLSAAQELMDDPGGDLSPLRDVVRMALDAARRLLGLINGLLDINRLEAGGMPLDLLPVTMAECVAAALGTLRTTADVNKVSLSAALPPDLHPILADREKIQRVITNLVANALKFTPAGEQVELRVTQDDTWVTVSVCDEGPGIPAEYRQRIFEKFVQVPGFKGRQRGTGLGLTFCKLAVEAHGGRIWVDCPPQGGSTFTFTLPARN